MFSQACVQTEHDLNLSSALRSGAFRKRRFSSHLNQRVQAGTASLVSFGRTCLLACQYRLLPACASSDSGITAVCSCSFAEYGWFQLWHVPHCTQGNRALDHQYDPRTTSLFQPPVCWHALQRAQHVRSKSAVCHVSTEPFHHFFVTRTSNGHSPLIEYACQFRISRCDSSSRGTSISDHVHCCCCGFKVFR